MCERSPEEIAVMLEQHLTGLLNAPWWVWRDTVWLTREETTYLLRLVREDQCVSSVASTSLPTHSTSPGAWSA